MAKSTLATYKKNSVWPSCALYVKLREANKLGQVYCVTCGVVMHYRNPLCNAGHFIPGRGNAVLFDDKHIFPQCSGCNCDGNGEQYKFGEFLKQKYGYDDATLEEILLMRHRTRKFTMDELKAIKKTYDEAIAELRKQKGLYD